MMTGETLVGLCQSADVIDSRGQSWWGYAAAFTGFYGPNSTSPDVLQYLGYCISGGSNPPCTGATGAEDASGTYTGLGMITSPRSKHPGGVNVGMCDGSVRFIKNSVNINVFQALASTRGGEVVSADSY